MRPKRRRQRMIDASCVDADKLDALFDEPLRGVLAQARRVAEIFLAVGIFAMPAGVDEDDVAGLDLRFCAFQIGRLDQPPFSFGDRDDDAGAEKLLQLKIADRRRTGHQMDRRVQVRRGVKDRGDLVCHHALLGVMGNAFELDLLVAREDRRIHAPAMAELVKFEPAHGINHGRHFTPSHYANAAAEFGFRVSSIGIVISAVCITVRYDVTIPATASPDACDDAQKSARLR